MPMEKRPKGGRTEIKRKEGREGSRNKQERKGITRQEERKDRKAAKGWNILLEGGWSGW